MATFVNQSGTDLEIPSLGISVPKGASFTVDDGDVAEGLRHQEIFEEKTSKPKADVSAPSEGDK
jgi:hypothetical protein